MKRDEGPQKNIPDAEPRHPRPRLRNLVGLLLLLGGLVVYALLVMQIGARIARAPIWLQTPFYLFAGLAWLWPARHLLRWMARPKG